jgi:hypothetical protein
LVGYVSESYYPWIWQKGHELSPYISALDRIIKEYMKINEEKAIPVT